MESADHDDSTPHTTPPYPLMPYSWRSREPAGACALCHTFLNIMPQFLHQLLIPVQGSGSSHCVPGLSFPPRPIPSSFQTPTTNFSDHPIGPGARCSHLSRLGPLAPLDTAPVGEQAEACGRRLPSTGLLPLRVPGVTEPGKSHGCWVKWL